ncbi:MAG TPA: hypothetical protein VGN34_09835 [Ktedonobacteraceae bacterium]|jgi:hypothetical protein
MFVTILRDSLLDPIFLAGGGILVLVTLILMIFVRSSEISFTRRQQQRATRIVLIAGLGGLLVVAGGAGFVHSTVVPDPVQKMSPVHMTPHLTPTVLATPSPYPTPTPLPTLTASAIEVLNTLCGAINRHDTAAILQQYLPSLQHIVLTNRTAIPKGEQLKFLQCQEGDPNEQLAMGMLVLQTENGNGDADGYGRVYQFLMDSSQGGWKVKDIKYCMSDGCISFTERITQ